MNSRVVKERRTQYKQRNIKSYIKGSLLTRIKVKDYFYTLKFFDITFQS